MEEIKGQQKIPSQNNQARAVAPEKKVDPYKVYGHDFSVSNTDYIEFYKNRFKFLAFAKNLVGRFDNAGKYFISPEVKSDLTRMPKEIEDMGSDFYKASNVYMKKFFYFDVQIVEEKDKAKASLYLIENVGECFENPHIKTHIADFVDVYDDEYRIKLRKAFNLVDVAVPIADIMVPELAVIMQDNYDFILINQGIYDIINQIYLLRMLELLEKSGDEGKAIVSEYKELVVKAEPELQKTKYKNNVLKMLLDRVIDRHGGLEKIETINKETKTKVVQEANNSIKQIETKQKGAAGVELMNTKEKDLPKKASTIKQVEKSKSIKIEESKKSTPKNTKEQKTSKSKEPDNILLDIASDFDKDDVVTLSEVAESVSSTIHDFTSNIEVSAREDYSSFNHSTIESEEHNGINLNDEIVGGDEIFGVSLNKPDDENAAKALNDETTILDKDL